MAPLTRRAAKAREESPKEQPTKTTSTETKEPPFEEPIALRSRRKASNDTAEENDDDNTAEGAQAATPRRKKLEVRIRDNVTSVRSAIEVHIPSSAVKTPRPRSSPVRDSQEPETDTDASEANQTLEPLSASKQLEEEATQKLAAEARLVESDGPESTPLSKAAKSARTSSGKKAHGKSTKQPKSQSSGPIEPESEAEVTPRPKAAKSTHVVFGDDDDVDKFVAAAAEKEKESKNADEEEQEDSDDEAPEAVSTAAAAKQTLKAAKAAIDAAEK